MACNKSKAALIVEGKTGKPQPCNAYKLWDDYQDRHLKKWFKEGNSIHTLAGCFERTAGAITSRLHHMGLINYNNTPYGRYKSKSGGTYIRWYIK